MCSRTDCRPRGGARGRDASRSPYVVTPRIKKGDESRRGAAETDGRADTYGRETAREADTWLQIKRRQKLEGRRKRLCV